MCVCVSREGYLVYNFILTKVVDQQGINGNFLVLSIEFKVGSLNVRIVGIGENGNLVYIEFEGLISWLYFNKYISYLYTILWRLNSGKRRF